MRSSFGLNYRGFLGSCLPGQLTILVDVLEVQADVVGADIEQFGHLALGQPHRVAVSAQLDTADAVLGGVEDQAAHESNHVAVGKLSLK